MATVSVVIPTYNRSAFVREAIDSVLAQTYTDHEIIVVDDGSTDDTRTVLQPYSNRIRYIHQANAGVSAARNTGILNANGRWLAFLDSDDTWRPAYLATQVGRLERFPDIRMQAADCALCYGNERIQTYFQLSGVASETKNGSAYFTRPDRAFGYVITHGPWQVGSTIFSRQALIEAGLFDTRYRLSEDFDLMARVALLGHFSIINEVLVDMHRRDEAIDCLTSQIVKQPILAKESDERIYEKLKRIETLGKQEHRLLDRLLASNRRAMGNHYLQHGNLSAARDCYLKALVRDRSFRSLGRYTLSFVPALLKIGYLRG